MTILLGVIIIIICILAEGFFAGSETGIVSSNRIRMIHLADKKNRSARIVISFLENPEGFLSTTLVGVNLSVIIGSSVATYMISRFTAFQGREALLTTVILLPLVLIFGEMTPKIIYRQHPDTLSILSAYPLKIASIVLFPFVSIATKLGLFITKMFAAKAGMEKIPFLTREEIRHIMLEAEKDGILDKLKINLTAEIFNFGKRSVKSVMVPLGMAISASDQFTVKDIINLVSESGYSRIPVYNEREDNIIGVVDMSDLAGEDIEKRELRNIILAPFKVEATRTLEEVLKDFQHNGESVAVVTDKDGRAIGIATLEDVVEEIFGEIEDEYDVGA